MRAAEAGPALPSLCAGSWLLTCDGVEKSRPFPPQIRAHEGPGQRRGWRATTKYLRVTPFVPTARAGQARGRGPPPRGGCERRAWRTGGSRTRPTAARSPSAPRARADTSSAVTICIRVAPETGPSRTGTSASAAARGSPVASRSVAAAMRISALARSSSSSWASTCSARRVGADSCATRSASASRPEAMPR